MARGCGLAARVPATARAPTARPSAAAVFEETHARRASRVAARIGTGDACGGEERGGEGQRRGAGGGERGIRDGSRGGGWGWPRGGAARGPRPRGRRRQPPNGFSRWNRRVPPGRTRENGAASIARPRTHRLLVAAVAHLERAGLVPARHRGARASAHRRRAGRRPRKQQRMPSQHHARATTGRSGACASARRGPPARGREPDDGVDSVLEPASPRVSAALDAPDKTSLGARACGAGDARAARRPSLRAISRRVSSRSL